MRRVHVLTGALLPCLFLLAATAIADTESPEAAAPAARPVRAPAVTRTLSRSLELCGSTHEMKYFDPEMPLPSITQAMQQEASAYPELREEYIRDNACVNAGPLCLANGRRTGGKEIDDEVKSIDLSKKEDQQRYYPSVTNDPNARDLAAKVSVKAMYARFVVDYTVLYSLADHEKFHANAEGLNLVSKALVDDEAAEQEKLAEAIAKIRDKFRRLKDTESERLSGEYEEVARSQAETLRLISCELDKMAKFNREVENRLVGMAPPILSGVTGTLNAQGMQVNKSSVSGEIVKEQKPRKDPNAPVEQPGAAVRNSSAASSMPGYGGGFNMTPEELEQLAQDQVLLKPEAHSASSVSGLTKEELEVRRGPASVIPPVPTQPGWKGLNQEAMAPFGSLPDQAPSQPEIQGALLWEGEWGKDIFERVHLKYRQRDERGQFHENQYGL